MLQIYKQNVTKRLILDYVNGCYVLINCKLLKGASVNYLTCWEVRTLENPHLMNADFNLS